MTRKPIFAGFGKPGEQVAEKGESYFLSGKGTDLGCVLLVPEDSGIKNPSLLEVEIKGKVNRLQPWTRLRVEVFDRKNLDLPATSFEDDYLMEEISADLFKPMSFPILGIVKNPYKVQFMVVGPSETQLELKNVHLR